MKPIVALAILLACSALSAKEPLSPVGTWKWDSEIGENKINSVLRLDLKGKQLVGSYKDQNIEKKIEKAVFDKDNVKFQFDVSRDGNSITIKFDGKLVKDKIAGKVAILANGEMYDFDWEARRGLVAEDVVGIWKFDFKDQEGVRHQPTLTIKNEKQKLTGQLVSELGTVDLEKINIKDGKFTMGHDIEYDGTMVELKYFCIPRGNKLTGKLEYKANEDTGEFEIAAIRKKPKANRSP